MNWPSLVESGIFGAGGFVSVAVVTIIRGVLRKPGDLVKLWMDSNARLVKSNKDLEKALARAHRDNRELQIEMFNTRRVLMAVVDAVETKDEQRLLVALERARALNNGHG